jgi:hypothetical protein
MHFGILLNTAKPGTAAEASYEHVTITPASLP